MRRAKINSGKNLINQFIGLKGMGIVLLVFFIGMIISTIILSGDDIFLNVILLSVNLIVQVIEQKIEFEECYNGKGCIGKISNG